MMGPDPLESPESTPREPPEWPLQTRQAVATLAAGGKVHGQPAVLIQGGRIVESQPGKPVILPGAFNPLHDGHRGMAQLARQRSNDLSEVLAFELSIENVDKQRLSPTEACRRLAQFSPEDLIWVTRAATFREKARLFPQATFVVGADTMARVAELKYYASEHDLAATIGELVAAGIGFLVCGRTDGERFQILDDLKLPAGLSRLCRRVTEAEFRSDVSSTELRNQPKNHGETGETERDR